MTAETKLMPKIIAIDDEADSLNVIKLILKASNFSVDVESCPEKALKRIINRESPYQLIITDVFMNDLSGIDLIKTIRQKGIKTPVIAVTGYGDKKVILDLLRSGCNEFLEKPLDEAELLKKVRDLLILTDTNHNEELLSSIINNINNFMHIVVGYSELALSKCNQENISSYLNNISQSAASAERLINWFLSLNRNYSCAAEHYNRVNLNKIISDQCSFFEGFANIKIGIALDLDSSLPEFNFSEIALEQLIGNLLMNAVEDMPEGGIVMIRTKYILDENKNEFCQLVFHDSGAGISEEKIKSILEDMPSANNTHQGCGTRLIMAVAKSLQAETKITSEIGRGTTFTIVFPLKKSHKEG